LAETICNTSPLQYLHQLGALHILPPLVKKIIVPPSVEEELNIGLGLGLSLPNLQELDWVTVRRPSISIVLPLVTDLGPGEREVLARALERPILSVFCTMLSLAR
jgi:predicted nucleic acid-binding protein